MGCQGSKPKDNKAEIKPDAKPSQAAANAAEKKKEVPAGRANGETPEAQSRPAPQAKPSASTAAGGPKDEARQELDDEGNPVVLPKGDWVKTEGTPFYYSEKENLYFHPPSCQFYDPTNEMWYDPEKDEWYRDEEEQE